MTQREIVVNEDGEVRKGEFLSSSENTTNRFVAQESKVIKTEN